MIKSLHLEKINMILTIVCKYILILLAANDDQEDDNQSGDDDEPSQGINVVTDEQHIQNKNKTDSRMFDPQLSDNESDKVKNMTSRSKEEIEEISKQLNNNEENSQDSLVEYERIISEKLELKRKEELK